MQIKITKFFSSLVLAIAIALPINYQAAFALTTQQKSAQVEAAKDRHRAEEGRIRASTKTAIDSLKASNAGKLQALVNTQNARIDAAKGRDAD